MEKNRLQEYFQKANLELPKYSSFQVGGESHTPIWESSVTLFNGMEFTGERSTRKKDAEKNAALTALEYIDAEGIEIPVEYPTSKLPKVGLRKKRMTSAISKVTRNIEIYVDVENKQLILNDLCQILPLDIRIYAYLSEARKGSLLANLAPDERTEIKITPSTRKDAADVHIILDIGMKIHKEDTYMIIITDDHFGDVLADIIGRNCPCEIYVCRDIDDVTGKIRELCSVEDL